MTRLCDVASMVRSKNAGPFWLTIDIAAPDEESFRRIAGSSVTDPAAMATRFGVDAAEVRVFRLPDLHVVKVSFPRPVPQGSLEDRDMHGGQQYVPLLDVHV